MFLREREECLQQQFAKPRRRRIGSAAVDLQVSDVWFLGAPRVSRFYSASLVFREFHHLESCRFYISFATPPPSPPSSAPTRHTSCGTHTSDRRGELFPPCDRPLRDPGTVLQPPRRPSRDSRRKSAVERTAFCGGRADFGGTLRWVA